MLMYHSLVILELHTGAKSRANMVLAATRITIPRLALVLAD